ncbi:hypothetical protein [Rhodanobacter lindaniclasticus]
MRRGARATLLVVWLLALAGLGWVVSQRLHVSTDLRSFMPAPTTPDQRLLMEQVGDGPGSRLLLLSISAGPEPQLAKLSQGLAAALKKEPRYSQVLNGSFDLAALDPQLLPYRYLLSPRWIHSRWTRRTWPTSCSNGWTICRRRRPACSRVCCRATRRWRR